MNTASAFPRPSYGPNEPCDGMTLRDYYIAHAPAEPQPWFVPTIDLEPPKPTASLVDRTEAERQEMAGWFDDMLDVSDLKEPRVREYVAAALAYRQTKRLYDDALAKARYVQWPAAWADEMLKARTA